MLGFRPSDISYITGQTDVKATMRNLVFPSRQARGDVAVVRACLPPGLTGAGCPRGGSRPNGLERDARIDLPAAWGQEDRGFL